MVDFETRLDILRKQSNIPGMVAGIIKNGNVMWIKSYGYADIQKNIPVRVPDKKLAFVLMANSDMLSAPYRLGEVIFGFLHMQENF